MSDGLFGMSRAELVEAVRSLRDEPVGGSGLNRLRQLLERLGPSRRTEAIPDDGGPLAQARDDAVRHERVLSKYAEQVSRLLSNLAPAAAPTTRQTVTQIRVLLDSDGNERLAGRMPIVNEDRQARVVTFECESGIDVSPSSFSLGPREERVVIVRAARESSLAPIPVLLDGRRAAIAQLQAEERTSEGGEPNVLLPEPEDALDGVLRRGQLAIIEHPLAAQALFRAFVAEGRRFGETDDGRAWRERLEGSELAQRGRVVWEVLSQKVLEESSQTLLPTKLLDAFVKAVETEGLEPTLTEELGFAFDDGDPEDTTTR